MADTPVTPASEVDRVLRRLVTAYRGQALVPFLGAGMSIDTLERWTGFVANLERIASERSPSAGLLLERSHRALQKLRRSRPGDLRDALRKALRPSGHTAGTMTPQTAALAALRWPLVLTTNYDDLYERAVAETGRTPELVRVLGRSEIDCRRVLASLTEPGEPLLWALHGYLGNVFTEVDGTLPEAELVVGYEEYRRVLHHEVHFRRAFGEVLRSRSVLFLGCGLADPDVVALLDETLSLVGPGSHPHFAVLFACEDDTSEKVRRLEARLNVTCVVLADYGDLRGFLQRLVTAVCATQPRQLRWVYGFRSGGSGPLDGSIAEPDLEIIRGGLPSEVGDGECMVVSAGEAPGGTSPGKHRLFFSDPIRAMLSTHHGGLDQLEADPESVVPIPRLDGRPTRTLAAFARKPLPGAGWMKADSRDARSIFTTTAHALDWARAHGCRMLRMQLLATGKGSPFPPRVALAQILRAIGASPPGPRVTLHVVSEPLLAELSAARIDVLELLDGREVRLWVEIHDERQAVDRFQRFEPYETTVGLVAASSFVDGEGWGVTVSPDPRQGGQVKPLPVAVVREMTLAELGILPGSTLRFQRL